MIGYERVGVVTDAGGGFLTVYVDRELERYPDIGDEVGVPRITFDDAATEPSGIHSHPPRGGERGTGAPVTNTVEGATVPGGSVAAPLNFSARVDAAIAAIRALERLDRFDEAENGL